MPTKKQSTHDAAPEKGPQLSREAQVQEALVWLEENSTERDRENLVRFAISTSKAFGVSMTNMKVLANRLGRNHELAAALWDTGWYEARMLATLIDEPARVTPAQMDRWCRGFDNWAICDTVCFALFDRTPHAWRKFEQWSGRREEFIKRAAFALLWGLSVHDKHSGDEPFAKGLLLVEREATDERHFVKKAVNMALRAIGKRSSALNLAAVSVAQRLSASTESAPRWVGNDALRELTSPSVTQRLATRRRATAGRSSKP
jgi:3-methyladenine DNA glycosylase AlkD